MKKPCAVDWAWLGGLEENTQIRFYLLFHWLSLSAQLFENIAIYNMATIFLKTVNFFMFEEL